MSQRVPQRSQQSYRHEALLWHDRDDFTGTLAPFVDEGLELGEPVLVAVTKEHTHWLRAALGEPAAERVQFVDMAQLGRNPARIIPAWRDFVAAPAGGADLPAASGSRSGRDVTPRSWWSVSCMRRS